MDNDLITVKVLSDIINKGLLNGVLSKHLRFV